MTLNLSDFLSGHVFAFLLVFTRLAGGFMMFPGIGEAFVPARLRMMFALTFSFMLFPVLLPLLPPAPAQIPELVLLLMKEALVGVFFGTVMRLLMDILETTGTIIGMEMGLSNAMILNPTLASQSALTSAFLGIAGVALIFLTGLDHLMLRALVGTYAVFPPGGGVFTGDLLQTFVGLLSRSFLAGVQLAAPFMIGGLLLYTVLGMMQKMMPQIQLFLVLIPVQILGGMFILSIVVTAVFSVWLAVCDDVTASLFLR